MAGTAASNSTAALGNRFLVVTMEGIMFVEECFREEHIPTNVTKVYQLILKIIRSKGALPIGEAEAMGYGKEVLEHALTNNYVKIAKEPTVSEEIRNKIAEIIGRAPDKFYA